MADQPAWLELLVPLPAGATPERKPVASAEQLAGGTAGPIAGWESLSLHLSVPAGSRHVLVTIDADGTLLSAGDHVMLIRESAPDGTITVADHESVGGRYDAGGGFHGTRWSTRLECAPGEADGTATKALKSQPSEEEVTALNRLVADILARAS